jgi:hypothetical protein
MNLWLKSKALHQYNNAKLWVISLRLGFRSIFPSHFFVRTCMCSQMSFKMRTFSIDFIAPIIETFVQFSWGNIIHCHYTIIVTVIISSSGRGRFCALSRWSILVKNIFRSESAVSQIDDHEVDLVTKTETESLFSLARILSDLGSFKKESNLHVNKSQCVFPFFVYTTL